jgi:hypothetical protein
VFVEINRRSTVPQRLIDLIKDLKTLTGIDTTEWTVIVNDEEHDADVDTLRQVITISPHDYRIENEKEDELNEMSTIAGISSKPLYDEQDVEMKNFKAIAGL